VFIVRQLSNKDVTQRNRLRNAEKESNERKAQLRANPLEISQIAIPCLPAHPQEYVLGLAPPLNKTSSYQFTYVMGMVALEIGNFALRSTHDISPPEVAIRSRISNLLGSTSAFMIFTSRILFTGK